MNTISERVSQAELAELIKSKALRDASLVAKKNGWNIVVTFDVGPRTLADSTGRPQVFPTLEFAAALLHNFGLTMFRVESLEASFEPVSLTIPGFASTSKSLWMIHRQLSLTLKWKICSLPGMPH